MVCRKSCSVCEYFVYDNDGKLLYTERGNEKHDYVYANGKLWCEIVTKGSTKKTYYHHTDHLGTTVCITDSTGKVVWEWTESAFGDIIKNTNNNFTPNFTGKFLDENTGLYYFHARWYDSEIGRFVTEDPARDGRNWFVYCENNPLIYVDPDGNTPLISGLIGAGIGSIVGVAAVGVQAAMGAEVTTADVIGGIVAGAVTGGILGATGNYALAKTTGKVAVAATNAAAGALGGAIGNLAKQKVLIDSGEQEGLDCIDLAADTVIGGTLGAALSGAKVPGVTGGKGSIQAVAKQMVTKGKTASIKTSAKIAVTRCVNSALSAGTGAAAFFKKGIEGIDKIREANKPITHEANNSQTQKENINKAE